MTVKVSYGKRILELQLHPTDSIAALKQRLEQETGVSVPRQRLFLKGTVHSGPIKEDTAVLGELGLRPASRFLLVGATDQEVAEASRDLPKLVEEGRHYVEKAKPQQEDNPEERKIIEKGLPSDVMPVQNGRQRITQPITGLLNNAGAKIRITLKYDQEEIWIASPTRTQKLSFAQISSVTSKPIRQHPGYLLVVSDT